jgi:hypothetical protein
MAVTSQYKIVLCPGSVFYFGTISSIVDEKGTLHRIANPPEKILGDPRENRSRTTGGAGSHAPIEDHPLQTRSQELTYPKNSIVHLAHKGLDADH